MDRYSDVLKPGWRMGDRTPAAEVQLRTGLVIEHVATGFTGAVTFWEHGIVVLEDRHAKRRSFPVGLGFLIEGKPVKLSIPPRQNASAAAYTASGSRNVPAAKNARPKVALPSRILVEGKHDAELVEKIWGDDLRHVGVVVELLGGVDELERIVEEFGPEPGRRLGVLVDHLVPGSKESRIAQQVARGPWGDAVLVVGHGFVDIWQAVNPSLVGMPAWPQIPRGIDIKVGTLRALGWEHADQVDIARGWRRILGKVRSWRDLDPKLTTNVERLIDFVTQDHLDTF